VIRGRRVDTWQAPRAYIRLMRRFLYLSLAGGLALLASSSIFALPSLAAGRLPAGAVSPVTAAKAINIKVADLPTSIHWLAAPAGTSSKAQVALAQKALACLKKVGPVSPDPFGTIGKAGGSVRADVSSPTWYDKASTLTQLPSVSSEVVFLNSAAAARSDLSTIGRSGSLACLTAQLVANSELQGAGTGIKGTARFLAAPRHGGGSGGVRIQFIESGGNFALIKAKLYDNEYFYVQGSAEVAMSFINLNSSFNTTWSAASIAKVMARAQAEVKS
jgi:hypothetical protein